MEKEIHMLRRAVIITLTAGLALGAGAGLVFSQGGPAKVAMLLPGSINDQSWNAAGYAGLTKLKAMGIEIAYSENVQAADHIEAMKDYARRGFSPIIGHSGRFLSAAQRVGPEFDKTIFLVGSGSGGGANVISIDLANEQFGYLAGVLAARMSKTGKVGAVAGLEGLPNMIASVGGFRLGVKSVRPDAEVKVIYLQSMEDPAAAKEAAYALIGGGADVIGGKLNAGHAGIIQAAKDKGAYAIGRSFGHTAIAPERVLTNIDEKWSDVYVAAVTELRAGKLVGNYVAYGYNTPATSGADLRYSSERALNTAVPASVASELDGLKKKFAAGELKVKPVKDDARGGA
jgi:simple sugar transport system substrate-binding protein/basic membrane protein A